MKRSKPKRLSHVIGERVRALRGTFLQEEIATAANRFGLNWTQGTVAAIETGTRNVSLEEFFLLPLILYFVTGRDIKLSEFIPNAEQVQQIALSKTASVQSIKLREIFLGQEKLGNIWGISLANPQGGGRWETPAKTKALDKTTYCGRGSKEGSP